MTMSDTLIVISVIVGFGTSLTAIGLLFNGLFPAWVTRSEARVRAMPVRTLLVGLLLGGFGVAASAALLNHPNAGVKLVGTASILAVLCLSFAGTAGLARFLGSRMPSPADRDRPWKAIIRGWVVLFLASLLPVLGWFVFLPAALAAGFGAAVLGARESAPAAPPEAPRLPVEKEMWI